MSAKIALQILGSIGATGTVSTGLWYGIPKLKSAFHSDVSDEGTAKSLDENIDVKTDVQPIEISKEKTQNTPHIIEKQTETTLPPAVSSQKKSKSKRIPGTHIKTIESHKWSDEDVQFDWTVANVTQSETKGTYFLAEVQEIDKTIFDNRASKFVLKNKENEEIMKMDCEDLLNECFPIYSFSEPSNDLLDLDLKKLEQVINWEDQKPWTKYVVFNLIDSKEAKYNNSKVEFKQEYNTLNEWKKIYEIYSKETNKNNEQNTLSLVLTLDTSDEEVCIKIKFINFLTPSFQLPKTTTNDVQISTTL